MYLVMTHCKDKIPKFWNKYSQRRNIGVSVPISTIMRLWVICIFPQSVCLFCWRKYVDRLWDYINRSQTHECGNWGWDRTIPWKGIHKWDFHCSAYTRLTLLHFSLESVDICIFIFFFITNPCCRTGRPLILNFGSCTWPPFMFSLHRFRCVANQKWENNKI